MIRIQRKILLELSEKYPKVMSFRKVAKNHKNVIAYAVFSDIKGLGVCYLCDK